MPKPRRRRALAAFVAVPPLVFGLDLITKDLAVHRLADREPIRLLGGAVYLVLTRNSGAAFSLGTGYTIVFPIISIAVICWIGWMARKLSTVPWAIALGLVLGGALGNLADRIFRAPGPFVGHVVDFISVFNDAGRVIPIFNVADSSLFIGVSLAVLLELTGHRRDGSRGQAAPSAGPGAAEADEPAPTAADPVPAPTAADAPGRGGD